MRRWSTAPGAGCGSLCCWRCASRRCCSWRWRLRGRSSRRPRRRRPRRHHRRARYVAQPVGAGPFERAQAARQGGESTRRRPAMVALSRLPTRADRVQPRRPTARWRRAAIDARDAGFGAPAIVRRSNTAAAVARRPARHDRRRDRSAGKRVGCRRPASGSRVGAHRDCDVGASPGNLAVIGVRADAGDRVVATVRNAGPQAREARVQPDRRRPARRAEASVSMGPEQIRRRGLLRCVRHRGGRRRSRTRGRAGDNARYVVLDAARRGPRCSS